MLAEIGIRSPLDLGFFLVLSEEESIRFANGGRRVNTDDNVWLEHRMPIELVDSALQASSDGEVGSMLARLGRGSRLEALATLWPGWPLEAGLEAMTLFPHRVEPLALDGEWVFDPWRDLREAQLDGARSELRARGRADLVPRLNEWARSGESLRAFREEASRGLVAARQDGSLSAQMLEQALAVYEIPLALTFAAARAQAAGDLAAAERLYRRALEHPESDSYLDALLGLTRLLRDRNEVEPAYAFALEATQRFPYYAAPFLLASKLAARRGDAAGSRALSRAGSSTTRVMRRSPNFLTRGSRIVPQPVQPPTPCPHRERRALPAQACLELLHRGVPPAREGSRTSGSRPEWRRESIRSVKGRPGAGRGPSGRSSRRGSGPCRSNAGRCNRPPAVPRGARR